MNSTITEKITTIRMKSRPALLLASAILLYACSYTPLFEPQDSAPSRKVDVAAIPDATPRNEPYTSRGNPSSYTVFGNRYHVMDSNKGFVQRGIASWYGTKFHGRLTSSGEAYDMYAMTAAHKELPLPTYARVTNLENGRTIIVKINDRGPFAKNRIIDLSYVAAIKLGITARGTGLVEVRAIDPDTWGSSTLAEAEKVPETQDAPESNQVAATPSNNNTQKNEIYLQVGAFQSQRNAERLRSKIAGFPIARVTIQTSAAESTPIYRVRIGPLASVDEVDGLNDLLSENGVANAQVVID